MSMALGVWPGRGFLTSSGARVSRSVEVGELLIGTESTLGYSHGFEGAGLTHFFFGLVIEVT
jgi:hypothetical protein